MRYLKRSDSIQLTSFDLDHIFTCLAYGHTKNEVKDNFIFEAELYLKGIGDVFSKKVKIPMHRKYKRFNTLYKSFNGLCEYMLKNKYNKQIIPFNGVDIELENN